MVCGDSGGLAGSMVVTVLGEEEEAGYCRTRVLYLAKLLFCEPCLRFAKLEEQVRLFVYCCTIQSHLI